MAKNLQVQELAAELGMTNAELLALCDLMGVGVKGPRSTLIEAQADRLRRRAERDGLTRPSQSLPLPKHPRVYELARQLGMSNAELMALCDVMGVAVKSSSSTLIEAQVDRVRRRAERDGLTRPSQRPEPAGTPPSVVEPAAVSPVAKPQEQRTSGQQPIIHTQPPMTPVIGEAEPTRPRDGAAARILYLTRLHEVNGRESIAGRNFIALLRSEGVAIETRHAVMPDEYFERAPREMWDDVLSFDQFMAFSPDCVFAESGLVSGIARFPFDELTEYIRRGGVVVIEGIDRNYTEQSPINSTAHAAERTFLRTRTADGQQVPSATSPYLADELSHLGSPGVLVCRPERMLVADWLRPLYAGIDRLVVASPLALAPGSSDPLASGEPTARTLVLDQFTDHGGAAQWAQVRQIGTGYLAVIAGSVVNDVLVDENPDNARWLNNLIVHLVDSARRERYIRGERLPHTPVTKPAPPADGRRATRDLLHAEEDLHLELKETARIDVRTGARSEVMEHAVLKTIAAFLNSDGGTLLIGVRDQPRIAIGLEQDLKTLGSRQDVDAFANWLTSRIEACIGGVAAALTKISFEEIDGVLICRVDVERYSGLVYLTADKNKAKNDRDVEVVYTRSSNSSRALSTADAIEYAAHRSKR